MSKPTHDDVRHLVANLIIPFYVSMRDMRVTQGRRRRENDAEHSWSLATLACAMAPRLDPTLDVGLVCQFAVVHDIVELYAGDTTPWGNMEHLNTKEDREERALHSIRQEFAAFPWISETIACYERKDTDEALFVWAIDKYLNQLMRNTDEGKFFHTKRITQKSFGVRLAHQKPKAHAHAAVGAYYDAAIAEALGHPEHFYRGATNEA